MPKNFYERHFADEKVCGNCVNFMGGGDWSLCCRKPPKEAQEYYYGFLCYSFTDATNCENFEIGTWMPTKTTEYINKDMKTTLDK